MNEREKVIEWVLAGEPWDYLRERKGAEGFVDRLIDDETAYEVAVEHMKEGKVCDSAECFLLKQVMETV